MAITTKSLPSHPSPRYPNKVTHHMTIKSLKVWEVLRLGWRLSSVRDWAWRLVGIRIGMTWIRIENWINLEHWPIFLKYSSDCVWFAFSCKLSKGPPDPVLYFFTQTEFHEHTVPTQTQTWTEVSDIIGGLNHCGTMVRTWKPLGPSRVVNYVTCIAGGPFKAANYN